jgi:uncharacterized protein Ymh
MRSRADIQAYRRANLLPHDQVHNAIADDRIWATFLRGDYDTAVLQAFKEVEVAVRAAARCSDNDCGTPLIRKAFDRTTGNCAVDSLGF